MESTKEIKKTILYEEHLKLGGKMVEFAGWLMPLKQFDNLRKNKFKYKFHNNKIRTRQLVLT